MRKMGRMDNFGIRRVERLDGNVGYLDVRRVPVPANAGPAITAAMELVAGTYALIIDLRHNGGGSPEGVVYWCSYLLEEHPTHLNDIFHADTGETRQFWALPYVPGTRYVDRPVYVLTSSRTFSGGEDFAYTLQALGRAEVIGETTGGGAHPTRPFPISPAVHIGIPFARSINPVTGTNWQGTGVVPDVAVPEDQAYDVAYARALRHVLAADDVPPFIADDARQALAALPETARSETTPPETAPPDPGRPPRRSRSAGYLLAVGVDRAAGGDGAGAAAGVHPGPEDGSGHPGRDGLHQVLGPGRIRVVGQGLLPLYLGPHRHARRLADLDQLRPARLGQAELLERAEQDGELVHAELRMAGELVLPWCAGAGLQVDHDRAALPDRTPACPPCP